MSKRVHVSKVGGHTIGRAVLVVGIIALLWRPAPLWAGALTCLTGTDPSATGDLGQIATVRSAIDSTCVCANFDGSSGKTHSKYVSCAKSIIAARVSTSNLRKQCKSTVTKYYSTSTCGFPASQGKQPCVKKTLSNGKVTCAIKPAPKCTGKAGKYEQTPCAAAALCIDAADTNHDDLISSGDSGECAAVAGPTNTPTAPPGATPTPTTAPPALFCGDHRCDGSIGESCSSCPQDCGTCPLTCCESDGPSCSMLADPSYCATVGMPVPGAACDAQNSARCGANRTIGHCCQIPGRCFEFNPANSTCADWILPCTPGTTCGACGSGFCVDHCNGSTVTGALCVTSTVGPHCSTDADCGDSTYCISNGFCGGPGTAATCRALCSSGVDMGTMACDSSGTACEGSPSSYRFKQDIRDMGQTSSGLFRLRPVTFRYKPEIETSGRRQYGLIAEEVATVYPELVTYGADGQPAGVRYDVLGPLLLNEVQQQAHEIADLKARLTALEVRKAADAQGRVSNVRTRGR